MANLNQEFQELFRLYNEAVSKGIKPGKDAWEAARRAAGAGRSGVFGRVLGFISGGPGDIMRNVKFALLAAFLGVEAINLVERMVVERRIDLNPIPRWAEPAVGAVIRGGEEAIGAPLFDILIRQPVGTPLSSQPGTDTSVAVRILERLFGFAVALDFGTAEIKDFVKGTMGDNAPTGLVEAIEKLPMNVGVNWAIGFVISQFVWTGVMPPLVEEVQRHVRPARLPVGDVTNLYKRKIIDRDEAVNRLRNLGFKDPDIDKLLELDRTFLGLNDLQQAYLFGLKSETEVQEYLRILGVGEQDARLLTDIYLKRAETVGGDQLRAVAQRGFLDDKLSEAEYVARLEEAHVPPESIRLELEAVSLVKSWQRKDLSLTQIKRLFDNGILDDAQTRTRLLEQKYSEDDANLLIADWRTSKEAGHPGLTENRILAYLKGGVLNKVEAFDKLVALGIRPQDATFLVENPDTAGPATTRSLGRATILAALKDEIIDQPTAERLLRREGESEEGARLLLAVTNFGIRRGKKPRQPDKTLSEGQIITAFRYGLATEAWAVRELVTVGFTEADAMLLVAEEKARLDPALVADWAVLT